MTLQDLQQWVAQDWETYPDAYPTPQEQLLLLVEEVGEVAEHMRKNAGNKDRKELGGSIGSELADVLVSLTTLANTFNVDLTEETEAFKARLQQRRS